jgi:hypothetical protein
MTSEADTRSRIHDTKMQGFHQIVALSQNLINNALWTRWTDEEMEDEFAKFEARIPQASNIGMTAKMDPPTVELFKNAEYEDYPPVLYFNLNFVSGKFEYFIGFGPEAVKHSADVGKWKFAFKVDLSLQKLSTKPQEIQDKILVPGEYSVNQLLLDFGEPGLIQFDRSKSTIPGPVDADKEFFLGRFLQYYIAHLQATGKTVLGYAVTVPDPKIANRLAPSFPPTLVKHQTMCFQSETRTGPSGSDMFMFLEMTGEEPKFPGGPLKISGNWVTPGIHGTMAICKWNFWDRYLFDHLKPFNSIVLDMVNRLKICAEKEEQLRDDEKFEWSCTNKPRPSNDSLGWIGVANGADFSWSGRHYSEEFMESTVTTELRWTAGSNQIKLKVNVHLERQTTSGGASSGITNVTHIYVNRELTLSLNSVLKGGLAVVVEEAPPKVWAEGHKSWLFLELSSGQVPERMMKHVETRLVKEDHDLVKGLEDALNGQKHFIFPAGGTFAMKDPVFNAEGDLLIGLNYEAGQQID